jgi:hypothetical protein
MKKALAFVMECYEGLNIATEKWGWSTKYNHAISKLIQKEVFPDLPFPELE